VSRAISICLVAAAFLLSSQTARAQNPVVRFATTEGSFDIELCEELSTLCLGVAPGTVTNFLNYVDRGDYQNSIIHRNAVPPKYGTEFVIQGGGFFLDVDQQIRAIPTDPPVTNTFNQSNKRGTVAMARSAEVNSATSQWFVNLSDNGGTAPYGLDFQNEGFTVFGVVTGDGMVTVDAIADLGYWLMDHIGFTPIYDPDSIRFAFNETPMRPGMAPVSVAEDALPFFITMNITRVPEPGPATRAIAAGIALAAIARRRAK